MKSALTSLVTTSFALLVLASCATSSSPANIDRGCHVILDQSLWGSPLPWRQYDDLGSAMPAVAQHWRASGASGEMYTGNPMKRLHPIGQQIGYPCDLRSGTVGALQAKHGAADRVTTNLGHTYYWYGWFGFGSSDGNRFQYFAASPDLWSQGIETAARQRLGR